MKKTVAILQSNYIPWKGNFHMMYLVDEYILYDDVQYSHGSWRNRNKIKTPQGLKWLTIPVKVIKGHLLKDQCQRIIDTEVADHSWAEKHWRQIEANYSSAPFWNAYNLKLKSLYEIAAKEVFLSAINYLFLTELMELLGFSTKISWSMAYGASGQKTDRLLDLLSKAGATDYLSGPLAKDYIEKEKFDEAGISLKWMKYGPYPEYSQLFPPFEHGVSVFDMLFMLGTSAPFYIWDNAIDFRGNTFVKERVDS